MLKKVQTLEAIVNVYKDQPDELVNKVWDWHKSELQTQREKYEEVLENIKVVDPPDEVEDLSSKRLAFGAGQMNLLVRLKMELQTIKK